MLLAVIEAEQRNNGRGQLRMNGGPKKMREAVEVGVSAKRVPRVLQDRPYAEAFLGCC